MQRRILGDTGISVSEFALGAMMFGAMGNPDHDESVRIIHACPRRRNQRRRHRRRVFAGESEEIVGKALKGRRDEVVLATKFGLPGRGPNERGGSRRWIVQAVEASLRRLETDHIDLYQMHRPDRETDIDETLSALDRPGPIGQGAGPRILDVPGRADRRSPVGGRARRPRAVPHRAAALLRLDPGVEAAVLPDRPALRDGRADLRAAQQRLAVGPGRYDGRAPGQGRGASGFDLTLPGTRHGGRGQPAPALAADAGLTLTQLATAFVRPIRP